MEYWSEEKQITRIPRKLVMPLFTLPLISFIVACFVVSSPVFAAQSVPYKMNFQGRLANASGTALTGSYDVELKFYTLASGGTFVWGETRTAANGNALTVTNGLFSVLIGEGTAVAGSSATLQAALAANQTLFLEVKVGSETLSPRNQLGSSGFAINSDMIDGIDGSAIAQLGAANAFTAAQSVTIGSANALQVKNGSTNLFNVDSTNSIISLGTTDTTGAVLVLDVKSTTGDPTGSSAVVGAMYYNSNLNKFRCYQNTGWADCITTVTTTLQDAYNNDSAGVADITTSSAAKTFLFKAGTGFDSATLFDIQDAGGINMFTVDSVNDRVYIGDSGADAVGAVLVLDTKNTTGHPTGIDGAMYYNSADKSFECYKNGLWADCNFSSLRSEWVFQEDFAGGLTTTGNVGDNGWLLSALGSGTVAYTSVGTAGAQNQDRFGVLQFASTTTNPSGISVRQNAGVMTGVPSNMTVEFDFAPVNAAAAAGLQQITRIGLHNSTNATAPTNGLYFQYVATTTAGNWSYCVQAACLSTGVARTTTANQYQRFRIQTNAAGTSVEFFINEVSVGVVSSGLPGSTAVYTPAYNATDTDATVRQWKTDYFQIKRNLTTLR